MLKIIYTKYSPPISDFEIYTFVDMFINEYEKSKESNPSNNFSVFVSNVLAMDVFGLRVLEDKISLDDIEFYFEDEKLEFDPCLGIIDPENKLGIYSDIADKAIKLGYEKMKKMKGYE